MKHGHQFDGMSTCSTQVGHRRTLDTSTTRVVSDMWSYVFHLKSIIFRFGHASHTFGHNLDTRQTWLRHVSNKAGHGSNMAITQPSTFFF